MNTSPPQLTKDNSHRMPRLLGRMEKMTTFVKGKRQICLTQK